MPLHLELLPSYPVDSWHSSSNQFVKLTINLHLIQALRMHGTVPPFPPRIYFVKYTNNFISFLTSNFRRILNAVCFLLGTHTYLPMKMEQSVPKRRHIKFRRRGITQKKAYNNFISTFSFALCLLSTCIITVHAHNSRFIWFSLRSHLIRNTILNRI